MRKMLTVVLTITAFVAFSGFTFIHSSPFGSRPKGERMERIRQSPNYRDGMFQNEEPIPVTTIEETDGERFSPWKHFLGSKPDSLVAQAGQIAVEKHDLTRLNREQDCYVWFGHSSYLLQLSGVTFLVDPVFYSAAPVRFVNKPFAGTDAYKPCDMPEIDYLVITHDHYDHLDYHSVKELRAKVKKVICPLGVGAHLERWGYGADQLIELDWNEDAPLDIYSDASRKCRAVCLPSRHFSGRSLRHNQTLWASFLLQTPSGNVFIGGDGGYDGRFARFSKQFSNIRLAILENGQYSKYWPYIHTLPHELAKIMSDLGATEYITVHHSKFCESMHAWDEPLRNEQTAAQASGANLSVVNIGQIHLLTKTER